VHRAVINEINNQLIIKRQSFGREIEFVSLITTTFFQKILIPCILYLNLRYFLLIHSSTHVILTSNHHLYKKF